jgi:hypothetical protein
VGRKAGNGLLNNLIAYWPGNEATAILEAVEDGVYDFKALLADGTSQLIPHGEGTFAVSLTPTRSIT